MKYGEITSGEIDALWDLQKRYKAEIGEGEPDEEGKERLAAAMDRSAISFYGVRDGDTLTGCCSITAGFSTFDYMPSGVLEDLYILPEYRHQGIARQLVGFAYRKSGISTLTAGCADCDVRMYRSLGFTAVLGNLLAYKG